MIVAEGVTLTNGGIFVVKFDRGGNVVWARRDGGIHSEGLAVALGPDACVYVLVGISDSAAVSIAGTNMNRGMALAKYTSEGEGLWAVNVASGNLFPSGLVVDSTGAAYWTVYVPSSTTIGSTNLAFSGRPYGALVRCDEQGAVTWVRTVLPPATNQTTLGGPWLSSHGDIYVCGRFAGLADFGSTNLISPGDAQIMVAKYNSNGDLLWARQAGGYGADTAHRGTLDVDGNFIVSGSYFHTASFGGVSLSNTVATNFYFVAKYNTNGDPLWARSMCEGNSRWGVATDRDRNVYFAGESFTNVYFAKLDSAGELKWARTMGRTVSVLWLHADALGHCYLSGQFNTPVAAFDDHMLMFTRPINFDSWIAKLNTTTQPRLRMESLADSVAVSWPVLADSFFLESSTNVADPLSWSSNAALPVVTGDSKVAEVPTTGERMFFRLRR